MSISKFFKEAIAYRLGGGHAADHKALNTPTYGIDSNGNVRGLISPSGQINSFSEVQAKASSIQTKAIAAFPTAVGSHGVNRNTHMQFNTETHFDSIRLILLNAQTTTQTGIEASIGVSVAPITDVNGMNSFVPDAFVNITWSAAYNTTMPAGVSLKTVSYTVSDWMDISSVNPISGTFPWVHVRVYQPAANTNITMYGATANIAWMSTASDGRTFNYWYKDAMGIVQGMPAMASGAAVAPRVVPFAIQYRSRGRIRTLGCFGDSLAFGQGATNYGQGYTRLIQNQLSSIQRPVEFANFGMPGASTTEFYNNLISLISAGIVPHWAIYHAGSPNDISTTIAASQINVMRTQLTKAIDTLQTAGSVPFITTWLPANTSAKTYGATDSLRTTYNAQVLAIPGVNVLDIATATSGLMVGGQIQYNSTMNNADGLHPNDVGHAAEYAAVINKFTLAS